MARKQLPEHDERSAEYQRGMAEIGKQLGPMAAMHADVIH